MNCSSCWTKGFFKVAVGVLLQVYNLDTGQGYFVLDMVKAFEKASGKKVS